MIKDKILLALAYSVVALMLLYAYWPLRMAVPARDTNEQEGVFLCSQVSITGIHWAVITENEDFDEEYDDEKDKFKREYIILTGNIPEFRLDNALFSEWKNKFIIYGKKLKIKKNVGGPDWQDYITMIHVDDWDIVKPVTRGSLTDYFLPNSWLTPLDYLSKRGSARIKDSYKSFEEWEKDHVGDSLYKEFP